MLSPKIILLAFTLFELYSCQNGSNMTRFNGRKGLYEKLFGKNNDYDTSLKPPDTTDVYLVLNLIKVLSLAEKDQVITLQVSVKQSWIDKRLTWDSLEFGNLSQIDIASTKIWV